MVTNVYGVQVNGVVNICPHVVVMFHMVVEALGPPLKLVTRQATDKTHGLLVLLSAEL